MRTSTPRIIRRRRSANGSAHAKNELITADLYVGRYQERVGHNMDAVVARVYPKYQQRLLTANAVDFDDLLVHVAKLLEENADLRAELDERYRFILVDEYQDTNQAQYQIVASLSRQYPESLRHRRSGPVDLRLARRANRKHPAVRTRFPERQRDPPGRQLPQTPEILAAADELIAHNVHRKAKQLKTENASGDPVELRLYADGWSEAQGIAQEIRDLVDEGERTWSDFAIFYRVNALSRTLETTLARNKIPYQIAGGVAFYERSEVKDLLCYLRVVENPADRAAFLRIVNKPTRGIGKMSVERLTHGADLENVPLMEAARNAAQMPKLPKKAATAFHQFAELIDELARHAAGPVAELLRHVLQQTGYDRQWDAGSEEEMQRLSNVGELISAAHQYDEQSGDEASLSGFLETASLAQDVDSLAEATGAVTLMTLHSAKGLEFPCVYLVGLEQNLLPHERVVRQNDPRQYEEERRLLFVGVTRAMSKLVLTHTLRREMYGRSLSTIPSDFMGEMRGVTQRDCTDVDASFDVEEFESDEESAFGIRNSAFGRLSASRPNAEARVPRLTTGAALAAGNPQAVELPIGFALGMMVRHPRYGLGTVVDVSGLSRRRIVTVEFETDQRREKFVAAKCLLQPVGVR